MARMKPLSTKNAANSAPAIALLDIKAATKDVVDAVPAAS